MLGHYCLAKFNFDTPTILPHRVTARSIFLPEKFSLSEIADDIGFFDYRIFPEKIMQFSGQWQAERREIRIGDIIVQCARLPLGWFRGVFAVRVLNVRRSANSCILSYGTLVGHAEQGMSTFTLKRIDEAVSFEIETFSRPALLLAQLVAPLTRAYQQHCTNLAIANVMRAVQERGRT
jgi:hypothetical protein